jgi:hypothetical protein
MNISEGIIAGFGIGLILLGFAALVCWIDVRKAHGKPVLPRVRRRKMSGPVREDGEISYDDATTYWLIVSRIQHGSEAAEPQYKGGKR